MGSGFWFLRFACRSTWGAFRAAWVGKKECRIVVTVGGGVVVGSAGTYKVVPCKCSRYWSYSSSRTVMSTPSPSLIARCSLFVYVCLGYGSDLVCLSNALVLYLSCSCPGREPFGFQMSLFSRSRLPRVLARASAQICRGFAGQADQSAPCLCPRCSVLLLRVWQNCRLR